jgi:hypothetical protein
MTPGYFPGSTGNPVHTPAGAGASHGSAPGASKVEEVPRSPNKRVLPASNEPGLWAADEAPRAGTVSKPSIGGIEIPYPEDAQERRDLDPTAFCGESMTKALAQARQHVRFFNQPPESQKCLAAKLYEACAARLLDVARALHASVGGAEDKIRRAQSVAWRARAFATASCAGISLDTSQQDIVDATVKAWKSTTGRPPP